MATSRASSARAAVDHSFEELYRGHRGDVYRAVLRDLGNPQDAEDVTQAAFLDAYRAVLRGSQPQSPRAWLLAIAENVRRRRFRTAQRRPREQPLDADFPLTAELPHELAHALAEALDGLPDQQRRVFLLREVAGLSYDEIAERVDATVASVQMLLFRARRALREQLEPPTVSQRRTGLLVPGWLTTLTSRLEVVGLAPRVAGAVGATVATVVGASVAVSESQADPWLLPPPPVAAAVAPAAPKPAVSKTTSAAAARAHIPRASASRAAPLRIAAVSVNRPRTAVPAETASPSTPVSPAAVPITVTASADPMRTPAPALPKLERPAVQLPLPKPNAPGTPELPLPVPPPSPVEVPPLLPLPPVVPIQEAAGAAGAAGASAPPLPVPSLPPVTLPPAP